MFPSSLSSSRRAVFERKAWGQLFGDLIRGVREHDGLSLEEVAGRSGMTVAEWEAVEAGQVPGTSEQFRAVNDALGKDRGSIACIVYLCAGAWGR